MSREVCGICWCPYDEETGECACEPEPSAWIHTDPDKPRVKFLEWRENEPGYRGDWMKTPLYTASSQRKPLTEEKIYSLFRTAGSPVLFARAIERAHGIGSSDVGT